MAKSMRVFAMALLTLIALLGTSACDSGNNLPATPTARPTATTEAVEPHRLRPRATPTEEVVDQPTEQAEEPTPVPTEDFGITYATYTSKDGDWSIDYPNDWSVTEEDPNVQFAEPSQAAFIQVTSSPMDPSNTNLDLVQIASQKFAETFGDSYQEQDRELQNDGSYRIDFTFKADNADWVGQVFVEGRQSKLYMLLLATSKADEQSDLYDSIFTHVIDSYTLPPLDAEATPTD